MGVIIKLLRFFVFVAFDSFVPEGLVHDRDAS
jgi:hypothetical protein